MSGRSNESAGTSLADTVLETFAATGEAQTERDLSDDILNLQAKGGTDYSDFMREMLNGVNYYRNTDKEEGMIGLYNFVTRQEEWDRVPAPSAPPPPKQRPPSQPIPPLLPSRVRWRQQQQLLQQQQQQLQQQKQSQQQSSNANGAAEITIARNPVGSSPKPSQMATLNSAMKRSKLPFGKSGQIGVKVESVFVGIGAIAVIVSAITMILSRSKDAPTYTAFVPIGGALLAIGAAYNGFTEYEMEKKEVQKS
jgi:hypothetical protein